ncbi:MAG: PAS domain-containing protein, partial [Cloacibacillus sp.]
MGREYLDEDRYRIAAEETGAAVFEWDLKTGAFYRSDSYLRYALSDAGADDILHNRGPLEMAHPQDTPALFRFFDEIKGGVARAEAVVRLKMKDGSYRWSRLVGIFCKDAQGVPSRTIGTIIDINDNYEKNMMIEGLLNAIPGGIAVYKVGAKLSCLYYSDGLPAFSHRTREEFDAINSSPDALERLIAPEDIDRFRAVAAESVTKRKPIILNFRCIDADGSSFWLHLSATPIREEEGCPLYYAVFTSPEQESAMYQGLVADSRTAVLVAERDTRTVLYINNALLRFFPGAEKAKLSGMKTAEIFPDKRMLMTNEQMASLSETEYSAYSLKINDGRYFSLRCRALTWLGRPAYIQYISDETEAHRQEAELQELVDRIPSGIGIYDLRGDQVTLRYLNDGYFRMTDSTREERRVYAREKFFSAVHPDDVPRVLAALHNARENMEKIDVTLRVLNGKKRYLWVRLSAILTPTGKDTAVIYGCFTDVDEQVRQQQELTRKFEERTNYGKALARGSKASLLLNVTRNTVSEVESEEEPFSAFCLSHDGDTIFNYITAHIPYEAERARYRAIFTRRAIREAFERGETRCVIRHHYASASFWVESVCEAMQNPYTGDLEAYCFSRDVSDEKRAEDVVNRLVATEYDSIFTFDAESGVPRPFMNSSLDEVVKEQKKMGDVSAGVAEYLRRHSIDVDVERVVRDHSLCRVKEALEKVQSYSTFFTVRDDDGRPCYKRAAYSYMNEDKKNVVCSVRDVTAEYEAELNQRERLNKALAEATRANAAKTDFLSNMSHEIRTPMNAIIGMTKLAREELSNAAAADEYLAQIDASGQYLLGVINDILDMSRIESGKFTLSREWASPSAIALSCVEMMMPMAHEKNITFVYPQNLSCVGRYEFFVDVLKTKQMLMNLLNNAFKFTKAGGRV